MKIEYSVLINNTAQYACAKIDSKVKALRVLGKEAIDFGVGDPQSAIPEFIINHLSKSAKKHQTSGYPSCIGSVSFRAACAKYLLREYGVDLDPKTEISSTIGSKEAIFNFSLGFINFNDTMICPTLAYTGYKNGTKFSFRILYLIPLLEK